MGTGRQMVGAGMYVLPLVFGAIVVGARADRIAPLRDLDVYLAAHPGLALGMGLVALNLAAAGVLLLFAVHFLMGVGEEGPVGQAVFELVPVYDKQRRTGSYRQRKAAMNAYLGRDAERMTPRQRRIIVMRIGGLCLILGVLGLAFLAGPPYVKSLIILAMVYGVGWLTWALARAR